jgi:hypothetical protein
MRWLPRARGIPNRTPSNPLPETPSKKRVGDKICYNLFLVVFYRQRRIEMPSVNVNDINLLQKPIDRAAEEFGKYAKSPAGSTVIVIPNKRAFGKIVVITNGEQKICETGADLLETVILALRTFDPEIGDDFYEILSVLGLVPPAPPSS